MKRIDEFISKLEHNQTTPNERRGFVCSLTKKEFIYFLKQDFSAYTQKSIDTRVDLFEEYIHQTEILISKFTINELKDILPKIKPQYVTIKNMFIEHLIRIIHDSKEEVDIKKIIEFKHRVEQQKITHEDIRSTLLKMKKEEFSVLLTLERQEADSALGFISSPDIELDKMYEYQAEIIAEILEEYTEEEMVALIPFLNDASSRIRTMFFKCLNERKANEIFLTNAPKYSSDIFSYISTPTQTNEKDQMIISILSTSKLYSLYSAYELHYLRTLISNKEIILDENSNIIDTTEEEITQEAAKYIANLRCREKETISRGILKKLSAQKIHDILNNVNKGLENIKENPISYKEFIELMNMPLYKAILFLKHCAELSEEEKKQILNELYTDNKYLNDSINEASAKVISQYMKLVVANYINQEFDYIYPDLLEMHYNKSFFNDMLKRYIGSEFIFVLPKCMNIFLSQLIEKVNIELDLDVKKEFYTGASFHSEYKNKSVTIGTYSSGENKIRINTNAYAEVEEIEIESNSRRRLRLFLQKIAMIEYTFHELRHAYQQKRTKTIGTVRDLYFLLDLLIHREPFFGNIYYDNNYSDDSREVDATLYSFVSTASLLRVDPYLKNLYWSTFGKDARELSKKRKAPQLRKIWSFQNESDKENLIDIFNRLLGGPKAQSLAEEYPMLDIITKDGYILNEDELTERYMAVEQALREGEQDEKSYEEGTAILKFLREYLNKIHNKKIPVKKSSKK